jgi:Histidine phosphatase superfamily (branch 2)
VSITGCVIAVLLLEALVALYTAAAVADVAMLRVCDLASHSGINRKLQLKPQAWEPIATATEVIDAAISADTTAAGTTAAGTAAAGTSATAAADGTTAAGDAAADKPAVPERATELELILKWGGELTKLGERQAMELGDTFRK